MSDLSGPLVLRPGIFPDQLTSVQLSDMVSLTRKGNSLVAEAANFRRQRRVGILLVLQGVNAGGKDGSIDALKEKLGQDRLSVHHSRPEAAYRLFEDVLLESAGNAPSAGEIAVFNRSYYEAAFHAALWGRAEVVALCSLIVEFEQALARRQVRVAKLFLHIDQEQQLKRLRARESDPSLQHLHNARDAEDQDRWMDLMTAFSRTMERTHTSASPWLIIPSNDRDIRNTLIAELLVDLLRADGTHL